MPFMWVMILKHNNVKQYIDSTNKTFNALYVGDDFETHVTQ